jgi:hypothetical protein
MIVTVYVNVLIAMQFLQGKRLPHGPHWRSVLDGVKVPLMNQRISDDTHHLLLSDADLM